jgi:hypothetical protein
MSQVKTILQALVALGTSTYDDLEHKTGIDRNKMRWACNSMKQAGQVKQTEEPLTKEVAWQITPAGRAHLIKIAGESIMAAPALKQEKAAKAEKQITEAMAKAKAKVEKKSNVKQTPADGGANIIRSQESENHVVGELPSTEVLAVVERPMQDEMPASGGSDEKIQWPGEEPFPGPFAAGPTHVAPEIFINTDSAKPPKLFAMISIDGSLHIEFAGKEINLTACATRMLADFLEDTQPAWN